MDLSQLLLTIDKSVNSSTILSEGNSGKFDVPKPKRRPCRVSCFVTARPKKDLKPRSYDCDSRTVCRVCTMGKFVEEVYHNWNRFLPHKQRPLDICRMCMYIHT